MTTLDAQKALRSALLNEAFDLKKGDSVVEEITNSGDPWGLRAGLSVDKYLLATPLDPNNLNPGTLLYVITLRLIENFYDSMEIDYSFFKKQLRTASVAIRSAVEKAPGDYVNYAQTQGSNAILRLRATLNKEDQKGLAEYYLDLDSSYPGLNVDLVMKAAANKDAKIFDSEQLKWIYLKAVDDDIKMADLAVATTTAGDNFINVLLAKSVFPATSYILDDYLTRIEQGAGIDQAESDIENYGRANALQVLTHKNRKDAGAERNKAIVAVAKRASDKVIRSLDQAEVEFMLTALRDLGTAADLQRVYGRFDNNQMSAVARWSADRKTTIDQVKKCTVLKDNLEDDNVRSAFRKEYQEGSRAGAQESMRNNLVLKVYDVGNSDAPKKGAFERIAKLIERDFSTMQH